MKFKEQIEKSKSIVVLQADNPDGDSLGSALALEAIFCELGKEVTLVCGVDIPQHLRYLEGWSRVQKEVPHNFDLSVIVDASSESLLESLVKSGQISWLKSKPLVIIDHHMESEGIDFASEVIVRPAVATSEIIYDICRENNWPTPKDSLNMMAVSIMSDSLGLTSEATTSHSIRVVADLVDSGVNLAELEQARRELMRKERELLPYKGKLLERVSYDASGRLAMITIPQDEIDKFSPLYNPSMLVLDEMRLVVGVDVAIAFKVYRDGKITAKIRCNFGKGVASELAKDFGGGGHPYAAGFKVTDGRKLDDIISQVSIKSNELLDRLESSK